MRIFVRAAGLDFEESDVWGQTRTPEFLAKDPAHLTPMLEEEGLPQRRAVGELRDHAVPLQQARPRAVLPQGAGRAGDGRQRDVLSDRHALSARRARDLPGARLPAICGRGRPRDADAGEEVEGAEGGRGRDRRAARGLPQHSSSTASRSSAATHPSIADIRLAATLEFLRAIDYELPAWAKDYMAAMEKTLGEAYSEPAADVRGYIGYVKSQTEIAASQDPFCRPRLRPAACRACL